MENIDEIKDVTELSAVMDEKKQARHTQLAGARETAKQKKLKRERDFDDMSSKLDKLAAALEEKTSKSDVKIEEDEEPEESPRKRIRVTKQEEEEEDDEQDVDSSSGTDSMAVTALRTGAVLGLAGVSWYMQNIWKKAPPKTATTGYVPKRRSVFQDPPPEAKTSQNLLSRKVPIQVGRSGFNF